MLPLPSSLFLFLLLLLSPFARSWEMDIGFSSKGPQVCLSSSHVVGTGVNAMCHHRNKTYIGGLFNRIGNSAANSFAVLGENDTLTHLGWVGADTSIENVQRKGTGANYAGIITTIACGEDDDFIYIGGLFQNVSNAEPYDIADDAYMSTEDNSNKKEQKDSVGFIVNNLARFNTITKKLEPMRLNLTESETQSMNEGGWVDGNTTKRIGFTHHGGCSREGCDGNEMALVRTIACAANNGRSCDIMFVGGYFSDAMGTEASSIARINQRDPEEITVSTMEINPAFTNTSSDQDGVEGVVMTITPMSESKVVFGGIYQGKAGAASPYMMNTWDSLSGVNCVINSFMGQLEQCQSPHPPMSCCESALGTIYSSLKIAEDEFVVGGEFFNTLGLEVGTEIDPTTLKPTASLNVGYQNLAVLSLATYAQSGHVVTPPSDLSNSTRDLVGGPDGSVLSLSCGEWEAGRCVEIIAGGSFGSWEKFDVDEDLAITKTREFWTPQGLFKLVWDKDSERYAPAQLVPEEQAAEVGNIFNSQSETPHSVNTVFKDANSSSIFVGGNFPRFNNMFKFVDGGAKAGFHSLPAPGGPNDDGTGLNAKSYELIHSEESEFAGCTQYNVDRFNAESAFTGAGFCCRRGSYCPQETIDIQCPSGWGYSCNQGGAGACPEGFYCPTAGEKYICPVNHVCVMGSNHPRGCMFWEKCEAEGLTRPLKASGFIFASMVLGIMFTILIVGVRIQHTCVVKGRMGTDKRFAERFNAFARNLGSNNSSDRQSGDTTMSPMGNYLGEDGDDVVVGDREDTEDGIQLSEGRRGSMIRSSETGRQMKIDLSFENLSVTLVNKMKILQDVTGTLESGKMTAIMGPSGCGKSTLLNALTSRIRGGGKVGGNVWINGETRSLMSIQHLVGFVPQEDTMYRDLTVRETLRFNARLKADPRMTRAERRAFVNEVVDILGLKHVQHSVIGDEMTRGISGGQRKRVNIGIELMGSPLVLFLDEPTSGLDATTTQMLIDSLETLANLGLTIAMVIHQPRMEVLKKIHNLVLLQRGGHEVYVGETEKALTYFKDQVGVDLPNQTSPADFFLDLITADQDKHDVLDEEGTLVDKWAKYKSERPAFVHDRDEYKDRVVPARHRPGTFYQIRTVYKRSVVQVFNAAGLHFVDALLYIMAGAVAGIVASDDTFMGNQIVMMINGMVSVVAALKVFGGEMHIFKREMMAGVSSLAYFTGKVMAHFPLILMSPIFFLSTYFRMAYPKNDLGDLYCIILCGMLSGSGLGYFISSVMSEKNATILGVISGLMGILFAGINPSLKDFSTTSIGWIMVTFNYGSWMTGALFIRESKSVFAAGFTASIGWLGEKGFHDVDHTKIYSQNDIYEAQLRLAEIYRDKLLFMVSQYLWYMVGAYFVFFYAAKKEQGLIGVDAVVQGFRNGFYDPFLNYLKYGQWSTELSRREMDGMDEQRRQKRAKTTAARKVRKEGGRGVAEHAQMEKV